MHPRGEWLLPAKADFSIAQIARVIAGAHRALPRQRSDQGAPDLPGGEGSGAQEGGEHAAAAGVLLLGLPAQHLDQSARRQPRAGRASAAT